MFASERPGTARRLRRAGRVAALLGACVLATCSDPTDPREIPVTQSMRLLLILDPDRATQPILVQHVSHGRLPELRGTLSDGTQQWDTLSADDSPNSEEWYPCSERYGGIVDFPRCLVFGVAARFGGTYEVSVSALGVPTATATATVPGNFRIVSFSSEGRPPSTTRLRLTWTSSAGSHRYVVAIRGEKTFNCFPDSVCDDRWSLATRDTTLDETVGGEFFANTTGPYFVDVYAMDRSIFEYLTTGSRGEFFPVPPAQNVRDGYGAVGAWVRRSAVLP
jgi:hypothetical protein